MHCVYMRARVCFPILASVRGQRSANLLIAGKADINGQVKVQSAFQTPNATTSYCTLVQATSPCPQPCPTKSIWLLCSDLQPSDGRSGFESLILEFPRRMWGFI